MCKISLDALPIYRQASKQRSKGHQLVLQVSPNWCPTLLNLQHQFGAYHCWLCQQCSWLHRSTMLILRIMVLWRTIYATEQKARMKCVKTVLHRIVENQRCKYLEHVTSFWNSLDDLKKYRWFAIIILCQVYQKKNICGMKASTLSHQKSLLKWPSVQLHTPATVKLSFSLTLILFKN